MTDDTTDADASTDREVPTEGEEPYAYWMPPHGSDSTSLAVVHNPEPTMPSADDIIDPDPIQPGVRTSKADREAYLDVLALVRAYDGYLTPPEGHPADSHPLDALRALRAVRTAVAHLQKHSIFREVAITPTSALTSADENLGAAETAVEQSLRAAGIPIPAQPYADAGDDTDDAGGEGGGAGTDTPE